MAHQSTSSALLAVVVLTVAAPAVGAVVNPSFEDSPALTGWATGGFERSAPCTDGVYAARGEVPLGTAGTEWLEQTFTMPAEHSACCVDLLYLGNEGGGNDFAAWIGPAGDPAWWKDFGDDGTWAEIPGSLFKRYCLDLPGLGGQLVTVRFEVTSASNASMAMLVDNLHSTPEPASLLVTALAAAGLLRRR